MAARRIIKNRRGDAGERKAIILLSLFFCIGIVSGQAAARHFSLSAADELIEYLRGYLTALSKGHRSAADFLTTALVYLQYPLTAAFFGFVSIGIALLPVLTAVYGFFLSYAVGCFASAFSDFGIVASAAILGLRCLITIPCYFFFSADAWKLSCSMARSVFSGRRGKGAVVIPDRRYWQRLGAGLLCLTVGICIDYWLSPELVSWAISKIL